MLKKILITTALCLSINLSLFAAEHKSSELKISQKNQAVQLYKENKFEESYRILSKLYIRSLSDVKINFYLGLSAFKTGRYEIALASFERVSMLNPKNIRNKLEMAKTQYKLKMYEDAHISFKEVLSKPNIPESIRKNIELLVAKIDAKSMKSSFFGKIKLGGTYDSNVNYGHGRYNIYDLFGVSAQANKEEADYAVDLELNLVHIYDIGQKNGYSIRNSFGIYNREYDDLNEYDITYLSYNPALIYKDSKATYELNFMFNHMLLHHESYLSSYSIMPNIIYKLNGNSNIIANLKYTQKNFILAGDNDRDANAYGISIAYQKLWSSSYATFKLSADRQRKIRGTRKDVDLNNYTLNINYAKQLDSMYSVKLNSNIKQVDYLDNNSAFRNTREDSGYKLGMKIIRKITPSLYAEVKATYEKTWSNQDVYSYDKNTYNIALNKTF